MDLALKLLAYHFGYNSVEVEPMIGHVNEDAADILTGNFNTNASAVFCNRVSSK